MTPEHKQELLCVAVLHDVVEDFKGPTSELIELRQHIYSQFGDRVYDAVDALTKGYGEDYTIYIERVALDWMARRVKIADLTHNMDTGRLPEGDITEKDFVRWDKYRRALVRLKND